jgi:lipoate-protein ligase A
MPETNGYLLLDPPAEGAWNMAVDEALLEWSAEQGVCAWRFYGWREPTLSLGYFQHDHDRFQHKPSAKCPVVRRLTGGGAIVHDAELTYSFVAPAGHPLAARRDDLYLRVHTSLIEALAELGIHATTGFSANRPSADPEPFLCFQRRTPTDVLLGAAKIAGSAQRRRRGAVLQHGSVLLGRSVAAPELDGLEELSGKVIPNAELCRRWLGKLEPRLGIALHPHVLAPEQRERAAALRANRYLFDAWVQ